MRIVANDALFVRSDLRSRVGIYLYKNVPQTRCPVRSEPTVVKFLTFMLAIILSFEFDCPGSGILLGKIASRRTFIIEKPLLRAAHSDLRAKIPTDSLQGAASSDTTNQGELGSVAWLHGRSNPNESYSAIAVFLKTLANLLRKSSMSSHSFIIVITRSI